MNKILITGGAGFIGSNLSLFLHNKGYNITVFDNLSPQIHGDEPEKTSFFYNSIKNKIQFIKGDIRNYKELERVIKGQEIVIHLASETGTGQSMYEIVKYSETNIIGTSNLLEILTKKKHSVNKIVLASSRAVYGEGKYQCIVHGIVFPRERERKNMIKGDFECKCPQCNKTVFPIATSEDSLINPISVYASTKYTQELLVKNISHAINIPYSILRFQNVYGPFQSLSNPYTGILSIFSSLILSNSNINIFEDGKESRDFIFIDDVVESIYLCVTNKNSNNNIFNVGTGNPISVESVAKVLFNTYQKAYKFKISSNFREGDIRHNYSDISKIKNILKFSPKINFANGIDIFSKWVIANNSTSDSSKFNKSLLELKKRKLFQ